ncbi:MAG: SRPBCC family protein [Tepidiformaceae bacterium]
MTQVEKDIVVQVPLSTAYNQWTQFEEFPRFMEGVHEVKQLDDRRLYWRAEVAGREKEWEAEIQEQVPDQRIIWRSITGAETAGIVQFEPLNPGETRIRLQMSYDPEGMLEGIGDALGFVGRRTEGDLKRFQEFVEERGSETGAWRGEIENPSVPGGHTRGNP